MQLSCRKKNIFWYLIPDFIAEIRFPASVFTMTRYGDPVVYVIEYLCNIWVGQHSVNCFDDYNIVIPDKFDHVFKNSRRKKQYAIIALCTVDLMCWGHSTILLLCSTIPCLDTI